MSIDLRSSETEPQVDTASSSADRRTPFRTRARKRAPQQWQGLLMTVPKHGRVYDVAPDVIGIKTGISNVYMIGMPGSEHWVLVDAGMPGSAGLIFDQAERRFGRNVPPSAIILTHGHFDHVGALDKLSKRWDVPIYAHTLEMPYLTGRSSYPPPDPTVGNGLMSLMSSMYPRKPIDLGSRVRLLPPDGLISQLPNWRWIHTPGHTPGHISLFQFEGGCLIAGDAFVTVRAESLLCNLTLRPEMHGPPMYFTSDWNAARQSVQVLAALQPDIVATGHGIPLHGSGMQVELQKLASEFELRAVPDHGRYIREPALADQAGVISIPPSEARPMMGRGMVVGGLAVGFLLGMMAGPKHHARWRDLLR